MKKLRIAALVAVTLAATTLPGCATLQAARTRVCDNAEAVRDQAKYAIDHAYLIDDPTKRAAVLAAANLALAAVATCPQSGLQSPAGPA